MEWISVEKELPPFNEAVLVFGLPKLKLDGFVVIITSRQDLTGTSLEKRSHKHQDVNKFDHMECVTHWMRLPKTPSLL